MMNKHKQIMTLKRQCVMCGKCCSYVAIQLDDPEDQDDIENIKWYLAHKNVRVYIDDELDWYVQFLTRCEYLNDDNQCIFYLTGQEKERPAICQNHSSTECEMSGLEEDEEFSFENMDDFNEFLKNYNPFTLERKV